MTLLFTVGHAESSVVASAKSDCVTFPHIGEIEDPPIRFRDVKHSKYRPEWLSLTSESSKNF